MYNITKYFCKRSTQFGKENLHMVHTLYKLKCVDRDVCHIYNVVTKFESTDSFINRIFSFKGVGFFRIFNLPR